MLNLFALKADRSATGNRALYAAVSEPNSYSGRAIFTIPARTFTDSLGSVSISETDVDVTNGIVYDVSQKSNAMVTITFPNWSRDLVTKGSHKYKLANWLLFDASYVSESGVITYTLTEIEDSPIPSSDTSFQIHSPTYWREVFFLPLYIRCDWTVTFNANGGTTPIPTKAVTRGETYGTLPTPTRTGYTFAGWFTAATGGTQVTASSIYSRGSNQTLYAHWTANTYTVTLDKRSGTGGTSSVTATYDAAMPTATMPTRTGYTFAGYYDATSGGTKYYNADGSSAKTWDKAAATTLYAHWTANTYTVTLDKRSGTGGTSSVTATYDAAMPALESLPTRTGYTFAGYYDATSGGTKYYNANGSSAKTWDKAAATTLYAHWTALKYELGYDNLFLYYDWQRSSSAALRSTASGEVLTLGDGTVKITTGTAQHVYTKYGASADFYNIPVEPSTTYHFSCTLEGISQKSQVYWVPLTSAYAYVDASPYYRTLTASGAEGDKAATFTTPANCAYVQIFFDVHDVNVYMTFKNIKITKETPFGSVTVTAVRKSYTYNDNGTTKYGTLATATRTAYTFAGWYTAESGGNQVTANSIVLPQCSTVWSRWTPQQYLVILDANGGIITGSPFVRVYYGETYGTLPTPTRTGYAFAGWFTAATGGTLVTSDTICTATADHTLYAHWQSTTYYTVYFYPNGGSISQADATRSVLQGATIGSAQNPLPTPTAPSGMSFAGWYLSASGEGSQITASYVMPDNDLYLYAKWSIQTYTVTLYYDNGTQNYETVTASYGLPMPAVTPPTRSGYAFKGYYTGQNGTGTMYYLANGTSARNWDIAQNTSLYAYWETATTSVAWWGWGGVFAP